VADPPDPALIAPLKRWRDHLHNLGLIGVYPDGVGFGNVSMRVDGERFAITGTQTGGVAELEPRHVTLVDDVDIERNSLRCTGPIEASSESMTHAAIYRCDPSIGAVVHVHHLATWNALMGHVSTTDVDVPYGTPAMVREIERLFRESDLRERRIAVMGGHREGLVTFGRDLDEAGEVMLRHICNP
jgi:ribulose-5-phosphate 4-epimerase/fuculose-1-phosphate aldolase